LHGAKLGEKQGFGRRLPCRCQALILKERTSGIDEENWNGIARSKALSPMFAKKTEGWN
jgi:hypothetical protein